MSANKIITHPVLILLAIILFTERAYADTDIQSWNAVALTGDASDDGKWQFWFDGHLRFKDDASGLGVSIARPGMGYRVTDDLTLWLGVARVTIDNDNGSIQEDRIWQQATYSLTEFFGGNISSRTRIEQRFRNDQGSDTGHRFRQFIRWSRSINENWSMVVWDEIFIALNDTDWGQETGFDQNRLYVGPAYHLNDRWRVEVGYMHNFIDPPGMNSENIINHNLSLTVFGNW